MLEKPLGGRGSLLGGVPGAASTMVMIIGGGVVGMNAAFVATGMGAQVAIYDLSIDRLRELYLVFGGRADVCFASTLDIERRLLEADLVIGAVLVHGARGPAGRLSQATSDDEASRGARGRLDRPGRLLRDLSGYDSLQTHLRG
jgi:alanine dehydrogenase